MGSGSCDNCSTSCLVGMLYYCYYYKNTNLSIILTGSSFFFSRSLFILRSFFLFIRNSHKTSAKPSVWASCFILQKLWLHHIKKGAREDHTEEKHKLALGSVARTSHSLQNRLPTRGLQGWGDRAKCWGRGWLGRT